MREISEQELLELENKGALATKLSKPIKKWELNKKPPKPPETIETQLKKATDALVSLSQQMQAVVSSMAQVVQNSHNGDTAAVLARVLPILTKEIAGTVDASKKAVEIVADKMAQLKQPPPVKALEVKNVTHDRDGLTGCRIEVER